MAITLKDEDIISQWSTMIDQGAGNAQKVIDGIMQRLQDAQIPGECIVWTDTVKSPGLIRSVKREFLIVRINQFKDYRIYICIRDYGVHLDCHRFSTVEPTFIRRLIRFLTLGHVRILMVPANALVQQDLRAWNTVVHSAVTDSVGELMKELGQDPHRLNRGSKGFLEIW